MSASDKKKLRKENATAALTERQRQERAEAKKLKIYTISFVSVMIAIVLIAVAVLTIRGINNSGVFQRNTVAAVIGDQELNSVELTYYYKDAFNQYYNELYSSYSNNVEAYLEAIGLDISKPLDQQINEQTGESWAQFFLDRALEEAKSDFALYNEAMKNGFQLPTEEQTTLDNLANNLGTYATLYGYQNTKQYLRAMYGNGSDEESFAEYNRRSAIADAYQKYYQDNLSYDNAKIREYEAGKVANYNSYTYSCSYMSYTEFRQGGTEDENGNITYSDAENDAAREALKVAAETLAAAGSLEEMREIVNTIEVNEESQLAVNDYKNELHTSLNTPLADWLAADERKEGDIAAIPNTSTVKDANGNDTTVTNGYYVVYFLSKDDNTKPMSNVRHLLVKFEGGTEDEETGETVYSDEEKSAAKAAADGYLKTWKEGDATEASFIELVKEHSDDTSAEDGGLFENIHPKSQYVANFLNWSIDSGRKAGDAEVIETEYGYHVMYYSGDAKLSYRDYMITNELRTADYDTWYNALLESMTATLKDTSKMSLTIN